MLIVFVDQREVRCVVSRLYTLLYGVRTHPFPETGQAVCQTDGHYQPGLRDQIPGHPG